MDRIFNNDLTLLDEFLKQKDIPFSLYNQIFEYLENNFLNDENNYTEFMKKHKSNLCILLLFSIVGYLQFRNDHFIYYYMKSMKYNNNYFLFIARLFNLDDFDISGHWKHTFYRYGYNLKKQKLKELKEKYHNLQLKNSIAENIEFYEKQFNFDE